jgi:glycogen(starch) synthase
MRLMMTTDVVGGVWTYTQELVEGIIHEGHEVVLVSLGRAPSDEQRLWAERLSRAAASQFRYIPTGFKLEWMRDGHEDLARSAEFLLSLIEEQQPDLLHSNQFCYGALPCAIPKVVVAHSDVVSWWYARHAAAPPPDPWFEQYRAVVRRGLERASAIVAPSAWMCRQLRAHYGVNAAPCSVIANGRSLRVKPPGNRRMQAITAGRLWDEGKNLALLLHTPINIPLLLAGESTCGAAGESNAPASTPPPISVNPRLSILGNLPGDDLFSRMGQSALYISPALYEPFGLAALEAALCGCALVLSDIPTFRELWADTAVFFDPRDANDLARTIKSLSLDPARCLALAAASQARALQLYSASTMAGRYLQIYADLLAAEQGRREIAHVA